MIKPTLSLIALFAEILITAATPLSAVPSPVVHASAPGLCSSVCRVPQSLCTDREAFGDAMVQQCTDDDTGTIRICSDCQGRTNRQAKLRNCMLLTARAGIVFGVPRGDVTVLANMDNVAIFDAAINEGALTWRGDIKNSLICKAGSDDGQTRFLGKVENTVFAQGIKAIGKGTEENPDVFFGPRFFISKGGITFGGEVRNNKFKRLEAEGKISFRGTFENNRMKGMTARSGFSASGSVSGNKFGRVLALTPQTAPNFDSNFEIDRIGSRGVFEDTEFTDNDAKLLRVDGFCNTDAGAVIGENYARIFQGEDQNGCSEVFDF